MSGNKIFLDTNIILYLLGGDKTVSEFIDGKQLFVSFITQLELLSYSGLSEDAKGKIQEFLNDCTIIDINDGIKLQVIRIKKISKIKLPDAIIAATSIYYDLPLFSADKGLQKIENFKLILYNS